MKFGMPILIETDNIESCIALCKEHNCTCVLETKTIDGLKESVRNLEIYSI